MRDHRKVLEAVTEVAGASTGEPQLSDHGADTYRDDRVIHLMKSDRLPNILNAGAEFSDYSVKVMMTTLSEVLFTSEARIRERLETERNADMPNLPSDGSKGQWKKARQARIAVLEWLLEERK